MNPVLLEFLSSLVHSSLDLIAAISSFLAVRYAAIRPDRIYRFGRGKAEGFAAVLQVCLIVLASVHLLEEAVNRFEQPHAVMLKWICHCGHAACDCDYVLATDCPDMGPFRATGSLAVRGDRAHYIADMSANLAVIAGIALTTYTPFLRADSLVGIGIALWLLYTGYKVARLAWSQLMDHELPEPERALICELTLKDKRINGVQDLRTRAAGPYIHVQMQLDLDGSLSLAQAHDIVLAAEKRVMQAFPAADILSHPHPRDCHHRHGNNIFKTRH